MIMTYNAYNKEMSVTVYMLIWMSNENEKVLYYIIVLYGKLKITFCFIKCQVFTTLFLIVNKIFFLHKILVKV